MKSIGLFLSVRKDMKVLNTSVFRYLFAKVFAVQAARKGVEVFCFDWKGIDVDAGGRLFVSSCWRWNGALKRKDGRFTLSKGIFYPDVVIDLKLYLVKASLKDHPGLRKALSLPESIPERAIGEAVLSKFRDSRVRVLNGPGINSLLRDKWAFYEFMKAHESRCFFQPKTVLVRDASSAVDSLVSICPSIEGFILKPVLGSGGWGIRVFMLSDMSISAVKKAVAKEVSSSDERFILQEFVSPLPHGGAKAVDLRMFCAMGRVFPGFARYSHDSFVRRENEDVPIPRDALSDGKLERAASKVASALSGLGEVFLVSVDFMPTARGLCLIEGNGQPGVYLSDDLLELYKFASLKVLSGK